VVVTWIWDLYFFFASHGLRKMIDEVTIKFSQVFLASTRIYWIISLVLDFTAH
jgi:hypothetical protein